MKKLAKLSLIAGLSVAQILAQGYKVQSSIQIGGTGGWDYLTADSQNRRLYVSHGSEVVVIDLDTSKVVGKVQGLNRIHGIALDTADNAGFISDGGANQVVQFKLSDLSVQKRINVGQNPDAILYDKSSSHVFAFDGRSQEASVVDAKTGSVISTIKLNGKPEFGVTDENGNVYVNIEDKNEIAHIDSRSNTVKATWSIAPCDSPSGLAIDRSSQRLFAVCDGGKMVVVNAHSGKVVATPAIGEGPDAAAFDPGSKLAFSSNGESGTLSVVKEESPSNFDVVQTVSTQRGARTMALDEKTHRIYLATAEFGAPAGANKRPSIKPGTFKLLVVGQ